MSADYASAHAAADELLTGATTGVYPQDIAAAGWGLLLRCEAYHGEGDSALARGGLDELEQRVDAATCGDDAPRESSAVGRLRGDIGDWRVRLGRG
ncbi:hypothetical protein HN371_01390 [Candidatus Poribacteria bacterium]|jgi:hypothetical protein|nr:hypothetical protein [Candidatus Poribacteria bacterium]MBT5535572.1 hypothetical protein [Candidatus Poribacteria bacterium]MBT5713000.1 hypothetical protein [Candidatus Poribacteria bacterium]MBT7099236.1 hypothetical protein [Candidatus Poribacteria bacterium]MBT7806381.1 hypothetical protein [Candidatus Poribacteria bacterium]